MSFRHYYYSRKNLKYYNLLFVCYSSRYKIKMLDVTYNLYNSCNRFVYLHLKAKNDMVHLCAAIQM